MTILSQSYLEIKNQTSAAFARKILLENLKMHGNNVKATAQAMRCSRGTVYLAKKKKKLRKLKDSSHIPKSKHPNHTAKWKEDIVCDYRKETKFGKRRLRTTLYQKEKLRLPESTIGKIILRHPELINKRPKRVKRSERPPRYDFEKLLPFQQIEVDLKEILDKKALPKNVYAHLKNLTLPIYQWTAIDVLTRVRFLAWSREKTWTNGRAFMLYITWWLRSFGITYTINYQTDGGVEFSASKFGSWEKARKNLWEPINVSRSIIRKGHPEDNPFVERSHRTDDEELYIPHLLSIRNEKDWIKRGIWWTKVYNLVRTHMGIGDRTPYQQLLHYYSDMPENICLFPPLILDKVSASEPFIVPDDCSKSVQHHIDYYQAYSSIQLFSVIEN
ncbi:MAG: integrase core domain-containing protein [Candidatus Auribacterota bacterium]|nr:integrase core domain-containing protein [Candidatus Auribacterota bacterium]